MDSRDRDKGISVKILLATHNKDKAAEFKRILEKYELLTFEEAKIKCSIPEEGENYKENVKKKIENARKKWDGVIIAEDSGLEIDSLGGKPGPYSAIFAGVNKNYSEHRKKVLKLLSNVKQLKKRTARFRSVIGWSQGKENKFFEGVCEGLIAYEERGKSGFGYDPIFIPKGFSKTFGELGSEIKDKISHRAKAIEKLKKFMEKRGVAQPG